MQRLKSTFFACFTICVIFPSARAGGPPEFAHKKDPDTESSRVSGTANGVLSATCGETTWSRDPELEDGHFQAAVTTTCTLTLHDKARALNLKELATKIKTSIATTRVVHFSTDSVEQRVPASSRDNVIFKQPLLGLASAEPIWQADTTHTIADDGAPIQIRESLELSWNHKALVYKTDSREIKATGMANYLKRVAFVAEFEHTEKQGEYKVTLVNAVGVDRPWYAMAMLFYPIAKSVTRSKFKCACDRLFDMLKSYF